MTEYEGMYCENAAEEECAKEIHTNHTGYVSWAHDYSSQCLRKY